MIRDSNASEFIGLRVHKDVCAWVYVKGLYKA